MRENYTQVLQARLDKESYCRLAAIRNPKLHRFIAEYVDLCNPASVFVATDAAEDIAYVRNLALQRGEERHWPSRATPSTSTAPQDQGRDQEVTQYLVPARRGPRQAPQQHRPRRQGLEEVRGLLEGPMNGQHDARALLLPRAGQLAVQHPLRAAHRLGLRRPQRGPALPRRATSSSSAGRTRATSSASCTPPGELRRAHDQRRADKQAHLHRHRRRTRSTASTRSTPATRSASRSSPCAWPSARPTARAGWPSTCSSWACTGPAGGRPTSPARSPAPAARPPRPCSPARRIVGDDLAYFRIIDGAVPRPSTSRPASSASSRTSTPRTTRSSGTCCTSPAR